MVCHGGGVHSVLQQEQLAFALHGPFAANGGKQMKGRAGMIVLLLLTGVLCAVLYALGRITLPGWLLAACLLCAFVLVRLRVSGGLLPRLGLWCVLFAALAAVFKLCGPPLRAVPAVEGRDPKPTGIVTVAQGQLTGVTTADGGVEVYTGIPYAAPPVGELRWREPQSPEPWEGVRVCDHFAPMSMQARSSTIFNSLTELVVYHTFRPRLIGNSLEPMSEDSLYLNIWKPSGGQEKLPVLVYIHGGSLTSGQPSWSEYNGESLARRGVIVVNFGYRLNVFGYLATEQLAAESPNGTTGNYGLLDQIAALSWVRENIAAFGGDPEQVTVCGESAGASSVNALCVSPLAKGLFRRAIAESSGIVAKQPYHTFRAPEDALAMGKNILAEFGASSMEELRAVPAEKLVQTKYTNSAMTIDGWAITEQPYLTYEKGENNEEALLNGFNVHEADLFMLFRRVTKDNYVEALRPVLGAQAEAATALVPARGTDEGYRYVVDRGGDAKGGADEVYSAAWFSYSHHCWTRLLSQQGKRVWEYRFTKDNGSLGANHGGELPYAFGCLDRHAWLYDASDRALSETMQSYWANFVKYGDPNGEGLPQWETSDGSRVLELGASVRQTEDPALPLYALLDAYQDSIIAE
ncbi:MAG: carboxylesterase family protein [Ruminococcaceae bacterium]|nr:carboxylesterase family protein [Oscillospiraceae bacterium]